MFEGQAKGSKCCLDAVNTGVSNPAADFSMSIPSDALTDPGEEKESCFQQWWHRVTILHSTEMAVSAEKTVELPTTNHAEGG